MGRKARLDVLMHIDVKRRCKIMRRKTNWKRRVKMGLLTLMGVGFLLMMPQLTVGIEGIVFAAIWLTMAVLGAVALYHERKMARRAVREKAVYTFKKKLRTPSKEARSRISVRLRA